MKNINISIEEKGLTYPEIFKDIDLATEDIHREMLNLANNARDIMRGTISVSAKYAEGKLEEAIDVEDTFLIDGNIGIGNISKLPKHWYIICFGVYSNTGLPFIPGRPESDTSTPRFVPGEWLGGRFKYIKGHKKGIVPKNPVFTDRGLIPINYIDVALHYLENEFSK